MMHTTTVVTGSDGGTWWTCDCGQRGGQYVTGLASVTAHSALAHEASNGDRTLDGELIFTGMHVWDYDLRRAVVGEPLPNGNPAERTWYAMTVDGARSSMMDGGRMWRRHPSTGQLA